MDRCQNTNCSAFVVMDPHRCLPHTSTMLDARRSPTLAIAPSPCSASTPTLAGSGCPEGAVEGCKVWQRVVRMGGVMCAVCGRRDRRDAVAWGGLEG